MMQFAKSPLRAVPGLEFYKLLGSGKSGFDPRPDWSTYALLQVWKDERAAHEFFNKHRLMQLYDRHASQHITIYMRNLRAMGLWSGKNPFEPSDQVDDDNPMIAVITRATIKLGMLRKFWNYVPRSQQDLVDNPSLLFTAGVGERPVTQMATYSLWKDEAALKKFAYRGKAHRGAVQKTQALQWYKEEMFTRFQPYSISGTWPDLEIPDLLKNSLEEARDKG
jgi:heme-degrading monooxygenase HmoA